MCVAPDALGSDESGGLAGRAVGLASAPSALADVHTAHSDLIARLRAAEVITLA
jgi:hypothetical protein